MGPSATADFLMKLVEEMPADRDQEHVPVLVWGDCRTPDRTRSLLQGGPSPLPSMLEAVTQLPRLGARALVIPCNTAHAWADDIAALSPVPLLHIVEAVGDMAQAAKVRILGLMATSGTLSAGQYPARLAARGITVMAPEPPEQEQVSRGIALVKAGRLAEARDLFTVVHDALLTRGVDMVALACTEIPLALQPLGPKSLDTTRALARASVRWWRDQAIACDPDRDRQAVARTGAVR
jgi:aspartate racemase